MTFIGKNYLKGCKFNLLSWLKFIYPIVFTITIYVNYKMVSYLHHYRLKTRKEIFQNGK